MRIIIFIVHSHTKTFLSVLFTHRQNFFKVLLFFCFFVVDKMIMRNTLHIIFAANKFWNLLPVFTINTHSFLKPKVIIIRPFLFFIFAGLIFILTWNSFYILLRLIILLGLHFFLRSLIFFNFNFLKTLYYFRIFIQSRLLFLIRLKVWAALSRSPISKCLCY